MRKFLIVLCCTFSLAAFSVSEKNGLKDSSLNGTTRYIQNNVSKISKELKNEGFDVNLETSEAFPITVNTSTGSENANIIVFDKGEFYMVIGDGNKMYDHGEDLSEDMLKNLGTKDIFYSALDNDYFYYMDNKTISLTSNNNLCEESKEISMGKTYDGQYSVTRYIYDADKYVKSRYGSKFELESSNSLTYMDENGSVKRMKGFDMGELCCYLNNGSENNCCTVAPYTAAYYLIQTKYSKFASMLSNKAVYDPKVEEPNYYAKRMEKSDKYTLAKEDKRTWDELFRKFRKKAYEKYGTNEGLTIWQSSALIENVFKDMGIKINAIEEFGGIIDISKSEIDKRMPLMISVYDPTSHYSDHTMCVSGYKVYKRKYKVLWFTQTETKTILEIRDGYDDEVRYFDAESSGCAVVRIKEKK